MERPSREIVKFFNVEDTSLLQDIANARALAKATLDRQPTVALPIGNSSAIPDGRSSELAATHLVVSQEVLHKAPGNLLSQCFLTRQIQLMNGEPDITVETPGVDLAAQPSHDHGDFPGEEDGGWQDCRRKITEENDTSFVVFI